MAANRKFDPTGYLTYEQMNIIDEFQKHILDLAIWRRALVISLKFNLANKEEVFSRLLREPEDSHEIMVTFFGQENADAYLDLMTQQISTYRQLVEALLAKSQKDADAAFKELNNIAINLADFFAGLSSLYTKDQWTTLFQYYEQLLYYEAFAIVTDNYNGEIDLFDRIVEQSYLIADHISRVVLENLQPPPVSQMPGSK